MLICEKHTYKDAIGFGIWKSKTRYVEIWKFPHEFDISPHTHPDEHIETMLIFGKATFCKRKPDDAGVSIFKKTGLFSNMFKCLSIPAGFIHWFVVGKRWPLIVINFSKFIPGTKPMSASFDIQFPKTTEG